MEKHKLIIIVKYFKIRKLFFIDISEYLICDKKDYVNVFGDMPSFPKKWSNVLPKEFFMVFSENTAFFEKNVE